MDSTPTIQTPADPFMVGLLPVTSVGFTGTRKGMTLQQQEVINSLLYEFAPSQAHHGDCEGADSDFHEIVRAYHSSVMIIGHPPINQKARAFKTCDVLREAKDFHVRDKDIVYESQLLLACPKGSEYNRSGTWTTIRFARNRPSPIKIVWPDGHVTEENL